MRYLCLDGVSVLEEGDAGRYREIACDSGKGDAVDGNFSTGRFRRTRVGRNDGRWITETVGTARCGNVEGRGAEMVVGLTTSIQRQGGNGATRRSLSRHGDRQSPLGQSELLAPPP